MEYDITETIANLVRKADSNFERELEKHEEALRTLQCTNTYYGDWLKIGVELLFSIFELDDPDFAHRLPELAHLSQPARREFLNHLKAHIHDCPRCALIEEYEKACNASINQACLENREFLLEQLKEEQRTADVDEDNSANMETSAIRAYHWRQHLRRDGH